MLGAPRQPEKTWGQPQATMWARNSIQVPEFLARRLKISIRDSPTAIGPSHTYFALFRLHMRAGSKLGHSAPRGGGDALNELRRPD